jgi:hypothetical protein
MKALGSEPKKLGAKLQSDIKSKVSTMRQLMEAIEEHEQIAKGLRESLHQLSTVTLPDLLASAGTDLWRDPDDGTRVEVKDFISGSLPKEEKPRTEALEWLKKVGAEDLIKNEIKASLGRGEAKVAEKVAAALIKLKVPFEQKVDVHPQTLCAFARERMRNGEKVPLDKLGLFAGRAAKVVLPKEK